jgi:polyisoprenoid-binding protein YceI
VYNQSWALDKTHSRFGLGTRYLTITDIDGFFKTVAAEVKATKPDFVDTGKFGRLILKSTAIKKVENYSYDLICELRLHGITKAIVLKLIYNGTVIINSNNKNTFAGFKVKPIDPEKMYYPFRSPNFSLLTIHACHFP